MVRVLANDPGELGSIPGRVIPKAHKMVLDATLLNIQHYKVRIKGKVDRPLLRLGVVAIEKGAFWSLSTTVANFTYFTINIIISSRSCSSFFYIPFHDSCKISKSNGFDHDIVAGILYLELFT